MKLLLALLIVLISTGCTSVIKHSLPDDVRAITATISAKEYELHEYDCSNMTFDLAIALHTAGYDTRLFAYKPKGNSEYGHAIVEIVIDGHVYYLDPTRAAGSEVVRRPRERAIFALTPYMIYWLRNKRITEMITNDFIGHLFPKAEPDESKTK